MKGKLSGILCALAGGALWGFSGTVGQYLFLEKQMSSQWLTVMRMLAAGALLLLVVVMREREALKAVWRQPRDAARLVLFAVFGLMTCQYTYMTAISYSNSATATALQYLGQALILLVTCIRMRRLPDGRESLALLLALAGVFLLTTHGKIGSLVLSPRALLWGIGAAVSCMLYTLLPGQLLSRYGSMAVTGYGMLIGGAVLGIMTGVWRIEVMLDAGAVLGVAAIVVLGTAAAFALYLQGVQKLGGVKASLFACTEPVSAAVIASFWLGTEIAWIDWLAIGLILAMAILIALPSRKKQGADN